MALVKYNNRSILNVTALGSIASGDMNLITTSSGVAKSFICSLCVNRHTVRNKQF